MMRRSSSRGQALVEFAVTVPVMMLFVLLTVDVGRAYWESIDAAGAARAGARMGIISDTSDIGSALRDEPNSGIPNTVAAAGIEATRLGVSRDGAGPGPGHLHYRRTDLR